MTDINQEALYFEHLNTRTSLGAAYRRFFVYPRINKWLSGKVLDVGSGLGQFLNYRKGTFGVDVNPLCVDYCKKLCLDVQLVHSTPWKFENESFDGVVMDNVLEHIQNPHLTLNEVFRILKYKGTLVVGVPGKKGFEHDPDHKVFYNEQSLTHLLQQFDLQPVRFFYTPFKNDSLNRTARQYCLFGVFKKEVAS